MCGSECFLRWPLPWAPWEAPTSPPAFPPTPSALFLASPCFTLPGAGFRHQQDAHPTRQMRWPRSLKLTGDYPTEKGRQAYVAQNVPAGFGIMFIAGILSGLLGIGSGAVKVLAMDHAMKLPFKVSTTTSNFMIGVTAAASAGIYLGPGLYRARVSGAGHVGSAGRLACGGAHAGQDSCTYPQSDFRRSHCRAGRGNDLQRSHGKVVIGWHPKLI